ncbi:MAG: EAL domain-containing protein [Alphaproteobacteria bacterium]|nr:EAL domain-containing protein [Alphaproteobacteria bacterium]
MIDFSTLKAKRSAAESGGFVGVVVFAAATFALAVFAAREGWIGFSVALIALGAGLAGFVVGRRYFDGNPALDRGDSIQITTRETITRDVSALAIGGNGHAAGAVVTVDGGFYDRLSRILGFAVADELVKAFAERLGKSLPAGAKIARLNADQFTCLLPGLSMDDASEAVKRCSWRLEEPFEISGTPIAIGPHFGIAEIPTGSIEDPGSVVRYSSVAARRARDQRRPWIVYESEHEPVRKDQFAILAAVKTGLQNNEFSLHYQPKIDIKTGEVIGVEALARWTHPVRGPISPMEFIPVVEETLLIGPFTEFVADTAARQLADWTAKGMRIPVAINVSANNLTQSFGIGRLFASLNQYKVPPELIEIEITETAVFADFPEIVRMLRWLRDQGLTIQIDDFGTGYSSLMYIQQIPANGIKIDQTFVRSMVQGEKNLEIVTASIGLAHSLGMKVVAEGVEDQPTLELLRAIHCDAAQGYHVCRPLPPDELEAFVMGSHSGMNLARKA